MSSTFQPKTYQKRPVRIQAIQLTKENIKAVSFWCGGYPGVDYDAITRDGEMVWINIPTLEGTMRAIEGDYVIKGVKGEFYPCKAEIFRETYQDV